MARWSYDISTEYQNGYYNPTFPWGFVQQFFNFESQYWDLDWYRVNSGGYLKVRQSSRDSSPGGAWMWYNNTNRIIFVSPLVNYSKNVYACAKAFLHERRHMVRMTHLSQKEPLMSVNAGTCRNYTQLDITYYNGSSAWRSTRRPWLEPEHLRNTFINSKAEILTDERQAQDYELYLTNTPGEVMPYEQSQAMWGRIREESNFVDKEHVCIAKPPSLFSRLFTKTHNKDAP